MCCMGGVRWGDVGRVVRGCGGGGGGGGVWVGGSVGFKWVEVGRAGCEGRVGAAVAFEGGEG